MQRNLEFAELLWSLTCMIKAVSVQGSENDLGFRRVAFDLTELRM